MTSVSVKFLSGGRVPGSTSLLFSSMEVRLTKCLITFHSVRLLRKTVNCSIVHRFALFMPTLMHWPRNCQNNHVLRAPILSCKIFRIYGNSRRLIMSLFSYRFFSFYAHFCNYTSKEKTYKVKDRHKSIFFVNLWNLFVANLELF